MGIFSFLKKDRQVSNWGTAGQNWMFSMGNSLSNKPVNETTAMQLTAVYACVRVLSEAVAGLPLDVFRYNEHGSEKAMNHPLYRILHDEPNPEMTSFAFRETAMTHLLIWGNSYSQIVRNGHGEIIGLYPLMPNRMQVHRDEQTKKIYYQYQTVANEAEPKKQGLIRLEASDVLHIPGLGYDGLIGYSPIAMTKTAIGTAMATEEYGARFFANGAAPSGVLEHPGTLKDPQKLRDSWNATYGGSYNSHKVAVLEEGMKFQPISISNEQAQFLETRKFQVNEIARIFRVPPHMIGDLEHATFSNIEHQSIEFVKYTVSPWVERFEQNMMRKLLRDDEKGRFYIHFNVEGLLRGDIQSRYQAYAIARQNGWMSTNDIRLKESMDLIPAEDGGDRLLVNGNMVDISEAGNVRTIEQPQEPKVEEEPKAELKTRRNNKHGNPKESAES